MKQYQRKIKEYKSLIQKEYIQETAVRITEGRHISNFYLSSSNLSRKDGGPCREESCFCFGFCWRTQMEEQIQSGHWGLCRLCFL